MAIREEVWHLKIAVDPSKSSGFIANFAMAKFPHFSVDPPRLGPWFVWKSSSLREIRRSCWEFPWGPLASADLGILWKGLGDKPCQSDDDPN